MLEDRVRLEKDAKHTNTRRLSYFVDAKRMRQPSAWWYQIWPLSTLVKIGFSELIN